MTDTQNSASLYVVITDFDGWEQTQICLRRLQESTYQQFQVIVVDHGTTESTADGLAKFPFCMRIRADASLWWSGATNVGIRKAIELGATQVMLLNNDCFVEPSTISELMDQTGKAGGRVVAPIQRAASTGNVLVARTATCFTLGFPTIVFPHMRHVSSTSPALMPTKMIVGGRGVVVPVDVFEQIGLFDEAAFPHYGADHDFYMRCRENDVSLSIATRASVEMDDTRTTVARNLGEMSWRRFRDSLRNSRSHRNVATLASLFKRHYPVRLLYFVGVVLNLARYFASYLLARVAKIFVR
ncbi:MAG: glycosyltransferase family 2 protein [Woeseiaceae bacterium]